MKDRDSGLPRGVNSRSDIKSGNLRIQTYRSKSVQEAGQYFRDLRDKYDNDDLHNRGLNSNTLQKLIVDLNMHEKGIVLPDADFDRQVTQNALNNVELYRGSSQRAMDSLLYGDLTYIGDGIHGDGLYFSTSALTAEQYGARHTTAYIDKGLAKVVKEETLERMRSNEPIEVQRLFNDRHDYSGLSAYALYKGFNVIHAPGGNGSRSVAQYGTREGVDYYVPLTREVLVFRQHHRPWEPGKWNNS